MPADSSYTYSAKFRSRLQAQGEPHQQPVPETAARSLPSEERVHPRLRLHCCGDLPEAVRTCGDPHGVRCPTAVALVRPQLDFYPNHDGDKSPGFVELNPPTLDSLSAHQSDLGNTTPIQNSETALNITN